MTMIFGLMLFSSRSTAQELHYADIASMNIWYNQSLKLDTKSDIRLNYRDVKYQSLVAFRTGGAMLNLPVFKSQQGSASQNSYFNLTAAGTFDQSNAGIFKNNTYLLGLSYAQQLSASQTFLAAGFQVSNTRSIFGSSNVTYPDQFDQYGPLPIGTQDPLRAGRSYSWSSLNAGISMFQNTEEKEWYVGASIRHINKPYTDELKTQANRLSAAFGIQGGLTMKSEFDQFGVYGLANWQANAYEYLIGAKFSKILSKPDASSEGNTIGAGIALRVHDAIIPNVQMKFNKTSIGIHYDLNISGLKASGYARQAFELAITQQLN